MKNRFSGDSGKQRLVRTLRESRALLGDNNVATELASRGELVEFKTDDLIIHQHGTDNELFILLHGEVDVIVNGRRVALRKAPDHVGEMCLVNPKAKRSASVIARSSVLALRISENDFALLAEENPELWRNLAIELADRLQQRGRLLFAPNEIPRLFIGCAVESLTVAQQIQHCLSHDPIEVTVWTDQVFKPSSHPIDDLLLQVDSSDFALFVVMPEDLIESKDVLAYGPRDNVLLELGLFMGKLGKERVLMVTKRGSEIKIPTDLLGLRLLDYNHSDTNLASALGPVCHEIRMVVEKQGPL